MRTGRMLIFGIILLLLLLLAGPAVEWAVALALRPARKTCLANLKQLSTGLMMYCQDYDDIYPPAGSWTQVVDPYVRSRTLYNCPATPLKPAFAMNKHAVGRPFATIPEPALYPMLFELQGPRPLAHGLTRDVAKPGRHGGGNHFGFADGHVSWLEVAPDFGAPYVPPKPPPPSTFLEPE